MPYAPPRPCPQPGCPALIRGRERSCPAHAREREKRKPARIGGRKRMRRNQRLARVNPLCVRCEAKGIVRPVDQWDHIVPLSQGGADDESNLQGLCDDCHREKTAADRGRGV